MCPAGTALHKGSLNGIARRPPAAGAGCERALRSSPRWRQDRAAARTLDKQLVQLASPRRDRLSAGSQSAANGRMAGLVLPPREHQRAAWLRLPGCRLVGGSACRRHRHGAPSVDSVALLEASRASVGRRFADCDPAGASVGSDCSLVVGVDGQDRTGEPAGGEDARQRVHQRARNSMTPSVWPNAEIADLHHTVGIRADRRKPDRSAAGLLDRN